jgi:hypothetical protein
MRKVLVGSVIALGIGAGSGTGMPANAAPAVVTVRSDPGWQAAPPRPRSGPKLYSADWSPGLHGWAGDSSWKTLRGTLLNDGTSWSSTVFAPYDTRKIPDYAVEARIRVIKLDRFGILLRHSASDAGYIGIVSGGSAWLAAGSEAYDDTEQIGAEQSFDPGTGWHTYRIEADGNVVRFLIDGASYATATDNRYLSGGISGLSSHQSQIEVSSFTALRLR